MMLKFYVTPNNKKYKNLMSRAAKTYYFPYSTILSII